MLSKIKLKFVVIIVVVILIIVFIFPNPTIYKIEINGGNENKTYFSLYKSFYVNDMLSHLSIYNHSIEDDYGKHNMVFGGYYSIVKNQKNYCFYQSRKGDIVLVTINQTQNEDFDEYATIDKSKYNDYANQIGISKYDELHSW